MKVMALIYADEGRWDSLGDDERNAVYARYRAFGEAAGDKVVGGAELAPTRAATTVRVRDGQTIVQPTTMAIRGVGPDGTPGTGDDADALSPGEQGQVEFLVRGEKEGFHTLDFDVAAILDGLPVGPVKITGKASGGVLVRNPYFNMTFAVPSVARRKEAFTLYVTVTNVGQGAANLLKVALDKSAISGIEPAVVDPSTDPPTLESGERTIPTLAPGDSKTLSFRSRSRLARSSHVRASSIRPSRARASPSARNA